MNLIIFSILAAASLSSIKYDNHFNEYIEFVKKNDQLGELGSYQAGKIEIVLDKKTVQKIEETQAKRFMRSGENEREAHEHSKIGIVARDKYWVWVRDAVIFPSGATGTFDRMIKSGDLEVQRANTVAILPITEEGKIVLNITYRHAIRDWVLEIPRGKIEASETVIQAAQRELREETGMEAKSLQFLGEITPYSGVVASVVPIYLARVGKKGFIAQDYSEAILGCVELSIKKIKEGIVEGFIVVSINNQKQKVGIKDCFLLSSLFFAEEKKVL